MALDNGLDENSPLPIEYEEDWRPRLMELRELRQAAIYEISILTAVEPRTAAVTDLIAKHGERIASISDAIAELLNAAAEISLESA